MTTLEQVKTGIVLKDDEEVGVGRSVALPVWMRLERFVGRVV